MIGLLRRKNPLKDSKLGRGVGSEAGYGHEREYVRLSLNAHSAHKLILDTSLGAPKIRSARTGLVMNVPPFSSARVGGIDSGIRM